MGTALPATHEALPIRCCYRRQLSQGGYWVGKVQKQTRCRLMRPLKLVLQCHLRMLNGAASPCRRLAIYSEPFRRHQSNDCLWDSYRRSALFCWTAAFWPIMRDHINVAVNWVCAWRAVHMWHMHDIIWSLGPMNDSRKVAISVIDIAILPNR